MSDRVFFPLAALAALAMIALACVWPQGLGARSPWPFGQTPFSQTPEGRERAARAAAATHPAKPNAAVAAGLRTGQ